MDGKVDRTEMFHVDTSFRRNCEVITNAHMALDKIDCSQSAENRNLRREVIIYGEKIETKLFEKLHQKNEREGCKDCDSIDI